MAISKLEEFSIRVIASWIKLLVIMHADKIGVKKKKKQSFLMSPQVLTWVFCFLKFTEGHLIIDHQKIYPKSESKMDTKNHEKKKTILVLQWVISVFKIQDNQRITLNDVCWVFDQKARYLKDLFQNRYLSDFISTIRLELTWSLKYESWFQNKKDC